MNREKSKRRGRRWGAGGLAEGRACAKPRVGAGESTNRTAKEAMNFVCSRKGEGVEKKTHQRNVFR